MCVEVGCARVGDGGRCWRWGLQGWVMEVGVGGGVCKDGCWRWGVQGWVMEVGCVRVGDGGGCWR